jgi:hypothetical protein
MVSASLAVAIQYFKAASIMVGFIAAVVIRVEGPSGGAIASDELFLNRCRHIRLYTDSEKGE